MSAFEEASTEPLKSGVRRKQLKLCLSKGLYGLMAVFMSFICIRLAIDARVLQTLLYVRPYATAAGFLSLVGVVFFLGLYPIVVAYAFSMFLPGHMVVAIFKIALREQWGVLIAWGNITSRRIYNFFAIEINPYLSLKVIRQDPDDKFPNRYLCTCNHQSNWDPWLLSYALQRQDFGRPTYFVYKHSLDHLPVAGGILPISGNISVRRNQTTHDRVAALMQLSKERYDNGDKACFCAFVEGTRSKSGEISPFKQGYPRFALQHQTPVVPCLIVNSLEAWPAFSVFKMATAEVKLVIGNVVQPPRTLTSGQPTKEEVESFTKFLEKTTADLINVVPKEDRPSWWGGPHPDYRPKKSDPKNRDPNGNLSKVKLLVCASIFIVSAFLMVNNSHAMDHLYNMMI